MARGIDARDRYYEALGWVGHLMGNATGDLLDNTTPCPEFTVRSLMGHLVGTAERSLATAQGWPTGLIPHVITDMPDGELAPRYIALSEQIRAAWGRVDPHRTVQAPWGITIADRAVWGFAIETLVHGWDLAVATNQGSEAKPDAASAILDRASTTLPATGRKKSYGVVVTSRPEAGPTERLANWLGHHR